MMTCSLNKNNLSKHQSHIQYSIFCSLISVKALKKQIDSMTILRLYFRNSSIRGFRFRSKVYHGHSSHTHFDYDLNQFQSNRSSLKFEQSCSLEQVLGNKLSIIWRFQRQNGQIGDLIALNFLMGFDKHAIFKRERPKQVKFLLLKLRLD